MHLLNMADVESPEDLKKRAGLVHQYLEASKRFSNYFGNFDENFRTMAIKGGISSGEVESQIKGFHTNFSQLGLLPRISEHTDLWARGELQALGLLESNWDAWSYDGDLKKTVFKDHDLRIEYNSLISMINSNRNEATNLQQQLKRSSQQGSNEKIK
jgi:hypothetical protein